MQAFAELMTNGLISNRHNFNRTAADFHVRVTLCGFVCPSHVPDRNPVDIELLMAEWHCFFDYDNDNDNDCIRCLTYF